MIPRRDWQKLITRLTTPINPMATPPPVPFSNPMAIVPDPIDKFAAAHGISRQRVELVVSTWRNGPSSATRH